MVIGQLRSPFGVCTYYFCPIQPCFSCQRFKQVFNLFLSEQPQLHFHVENRAETVVSSDAPVTVPIFNMLYTHFDAVAWPPRRVYSIGLLNPRSVWASFARRLFFINNIRQVPNFLVQLDLQLAFLVDRQLRCRVQDAFALFPIAIV